ncbi:MAG: Phage protein [Lachnoclostridium sp.]
MIVNTGYSSSNILYKNTYNKVQNNKFDSEKLNEKKEVAKEEPSVLDYNEKAFYSVGPNAPESVKKAWMEAAREVGTNGLGMLQNGMISHISQMMVQRVVNWYNGKANDTDILGNTVESAIQATKQALYDLDNPLLSNTKSIEAQQMRMKERQFYTTFLEKLYKL